MMSHRTRSRTVDSTDSKKPRRLTEKIAIMKKREHEQLEAFEHAMQSIQEMQQARIHSGGGSMPSLQAIDSTPPGPSIDMQMVLQDYNEVTQGRSKSISNSISNSKDRPHSSGPSGRRCAVIRTTSMDTEPYPTSGHNHSDHYWNVSHSGEWMEGELARHKSDSDLQQSLLMQSSPQHVSIPHTSQQQQQQQQSRNGKLNSPTDLGLWRRTNSASTAHALLSPDQYVGSADLPIPSPLGLSGAGGTTSSLPDLTNIEFSSGLEVPLEKDEPSAHPRIHPPPPAPFTHQQQIFFQQQQQLQYHHQQQQQQQQSLRGRSFFSPPAAGAVGGPRPSNLLYTSFPSNNIHPSSFNNMPPNLIQSLPPVPSYNTGFQFPVLPSNTGTKQGGMGMRTGTSPLTAFQAVSSPVGGITKSPTMPDFRTLHSMPLHPMSAAPHEYPFTHVRPLMTANLHAANMPAYSSPMGSFMPHIMDHGNPGAGILPPMTILIQSPNVIQAVPTTAAAAAKGLTAEKQPVQPHRQDTAHLQQQQQQQQQQRKQHTSIVDSPANSNASTNSYVDSPAHDTPPPSCSSSSKSALPSFHAGNSLPTTPTIIGGQPVLPSYVEARQQQSLQQKFASINVGKAEALIRSHSEENLQKVQKEKSELIQQNPFMGTLTNANSVPCVYVEPQNMEQQPEGPDSPTNLDSPSTSASYASSPPSVRPFWLDHPNSLNEFVFHEWPLESVGLGAGGRSGSPPHHHRSLTDLIQNPIPELNELDPGNRSKSLLHQLSLPSVAMMDLTVEEQAERHHSGSPSEFLVPPSTDFDMEDSVMDMIKNDVSDLHSFDMSHIETGMLQHAGALLSSSPDSFLRNNNY